MKATQKYVSRELGLEVAYICGKYFFKLEHLHYGYWNNGLAVDISNLHLAQEEYAKFVLSHIPEPVGTILDVGCGTGGIAGKLLDAGYKVDGVSPSAFLKKHAEQLLGDKCHIFECGYEQLDTTNRYDMILFCESFQYVKLEQALQKTCELLNDGGYLFISDFFRKDIEGKSPMSGGHKLSKFHEFIGRRPFKLVKDIDITGQTAPSIDLLNDAMTNVVEPVIEAGQRLLKSRYPVLLKLLRWKYRKKIEKLQNKHLRGAKTGENFKKYKSYRLFVYQKNAE